MSMEERSGSRPGLRSVQTASGASAAHKLGDSDAGSRAGIRCEGTGDDEA